MLSELVKASRRAKLNRDDIYERYGCHLYVAIAENGAHSRIKQPKYPAIDPCVSGQMFRRNVPFDEPGSILRGSSVVSVVVEPLCTKVLCWHPLLIHAKARSFDRTRPSVEVELGAAVLNTRVKSKGLSARGL